MLEYTYEGRQTVQGVLGMMLLCVADCRRAVCESISPYVDKLHFCQGILFRYCLSHPKLFCVCTSISVYPKCYLVCHKTK